MPSAKTIHCKVLEVRWLTPTVMELLFEPEKLFSFEPGQFLSVVVPEPNAPSVHVKRMYSFASPYEVAKLEGYRLCVKYLPGGVGSEYIKKLKTGDRFRICAPYGDFVFQVPEMRRSLCLICTGSGIAPMRSILLSQSYKEALPKSTSLLFGARTPDEILYPELAKLGIQVVNAISQGAGDSGGYSGRVTQYLASLPKSHPWHMTDYYLCGNGAMISEVMNFLVGYRGVDPTSIHHEAFGAAVSRPAKIVALKKAA